MKKDSYQINLEKMDLKDQVGNQVEKLLKSKSENPQSRVIWKDFDDKRIIITIELVDPDEPKGIL